MTKANENTTLIMIHVITFIFTSLNLIFANGFRKRLGLIKIKQSVFAVAADVLGVTYKLSLGKFLGLLFFCRSFRKLTLLIFLNTIPILMKKKVLNNVMVDDVIILDKGNRRSV